MFMPDDINNLSNYTGVNSETTNTILPEIDINNPLIFTPSAESLSVPITQLNDLDNMILSQDSAIYESTVDISTNSSVDTLTGEAIGQVINQAVIKGYQYLHEFAANPEFEAKMDLAFGENWDKEANISLPAIGVISSAEINGANGAFAEATKTIYLSQEFLANNLGNIGEVTDVWLEEFGHYIDSQINIIDAVGDEGEIFSAVVQGKDLSEADIEALKGENDKAFVEIDGEILEIENNYEWVRYRIQEGDTLSQIALNTTGDANRYWDIANYNGIANPNDIQAGVEIWVPSNNSTETAVGVTTGNNNNWEAYTVQPGDSLWAIAQRTTGDPYQYQNIARYNNLDPNAILPEGVPIWVPSNNSTGTTVGVTTGGSSGTSDTGGIDFIETFAEPHSREVDMFPGLQLVRQDSPDSLEITIDRIDGQGYIQNDLETWIVIHGWNDWPTGGGLINATQLANAIEGYDNSNQVLTLDWSGMANTGNFDQFNDLHDAAIWIDEVAEATVEQLNEWGFDRNNINLVGHSLGAYIAYEISEQLGGVNNLVALDPARSTEGGYAIDGVNFSSYSQWSWGFYSSLLGNEDATRTADESFKIDFAWGNDFEKHGAVKQLWVNMLGNPNGGVSQYFGLEDMNGNGKFWNIDAPGFDSSWEAEIEAVDTLGLFSSNWVPNIARAI